MNSVRRNEIWKYIQTYLQNNYQVKAYSISNLKNDLGLDSIDKINLALELEKEFNFCVSEDTIHGWKTIGDIIDTVYYATK